MVLTTSHENLIPFLELGILLGLYSQGIRFSKNKLFMRQFGASPPMKTVVVATVSALATVVAASRGFFWPTKAHASLNKAVGVATKTGFSYEPQEVIN
jgi:hypothetical protein